MRIQSRNIVLAALMVFCVLAALLPSMALAGEIAFTGLTNVYGILGANPTIATSISADGQYIVGISAVDEFGTAAGTVWSPTGVGLNTNIPQLPGGVYGDLLGVLPTAAASIPGGLFAVGTRIDYNGSHLWAPQCELHASRIQYVRADGWNGTETGIVTSVSRAPDLNSLVVAGCFTQTGKAWYNTIASVSFFPTPCDTQVIGAGKALAVSGDGSTVFGIDQTSGSGNVWSLTRTPSQPAVPVSPSLTLSADNPFPLTSSMFSGIDAASGHRMGPAMGFNNDGSIIVGSSGGQAVKWTSAAGAVTLAGLSGQTITHAAAVTDDGSIVVGFGSDGGTSVALAWDASNNAFDIQAQLSANGVNLSGWQLEAATGISADGKSIVGYGWYDGLLQGWLANLSTDIFNPLPVPTGKTYDWVGGYYYSGFTDPTNWSPLDEGPTATSRLRFNKGHNADTFLTGDFTCAGMVVTGNLFLPLYSHTLTLAPSPKDGFTGALEISEGGSVNIQLGTFNVDSVNLGAGYLMVYNGSSMNVTGELKVADTSGVGSCAIEGPLTAGSIVVGDSSKGAGSGNLSLNVGPVNVAGDVTIYSRSDINSYQNVAVDFTAQNFSIGSGGTLQVVGWATINANFSNDGTIWAMADLNAPVAHGQLTINGSVAQVSGGALTGGQWWLLNSTITLSSVGDITSNYASVYLLGSSEFTNLRNLQNNYGTLLVANGHPAGNLCSLNNAGSFYVENDQTQWTIAGDLVNSGYMWISNGAGDTGIGNPRLIVDGVVNNTGNLRLQDGVLAAKTVSNLGGTISGKGKIQAHVINAGTIAPDADGTLVVVAGLTQQASGTLSFVAASNSLGSINVLDARVILDGKLAVDFANQAISSATLLTFSDPNPVIKFRTMQATGLSPCKAMVPFRSAGAYGVNVVDIIAPQFKSDFAHAPTLGDALPGADITPPDAPTGVSVALAMDIVLGANVIQMSDGRTDGTANVAIGLPVTLDNQFLNVEFSYRFLSDGKLKILLGGQLQDEIIAPSYGDGRTAYATYNVTYDLATLGLSGDSELELVLTNPSGDPQINLGEIQLASIPEPATLTLLAIGGLAMLRRRKSA